jgi:hypothetical protein
MSPALRCLVDIVRNENDLRDNGVHGDAGK